MLHWSLVFAPKTLKSARNVGGGDRFANFRSTAISKQTSHNDPEHIFIQDMQYVNEKENTLTPVIIKDETDMPAAQDMHACVVTPSTNSFTPCSLKLALLKVLRCFVGGGNK
jgi:hypothetical protein